MLESKLQDQTEKIAEIQRCFLKVFSSPQGEQVLKYLRDYSRVNFPNYENVNATYAKAGQQQLVDHIEMVIYKAKKGGSNVSRASGGNKRHSEK